MPTENIFKQLKRLKFKLENYKPNWKLERPQSRRKSLCNNKNLTTLHPKHHLLRKKMMDTSRLSKKLRQRWLLCKRAWTKELLQQTAELSKCKKKLEICQTSVPLLTCTDPLQT